MPTKHWNRIRFHTSIEGKKIQIYCRHQETYDSLVAEVAHMTGTDLSAGIIRNRIKNPNSKNHNLPVGISESKGERSKSKDGGPRIMKTRKGNPVGRFMTWLGKKSFACTYGDKRTRDEALNVVIQARLDYIASLNDQK